jgi:TonB family protein
MSEILARFGLLIFVCLFVSVSVAEAETKTCNLRFKIFSYNRISSNSFIENIEVILTNLKNKEKKISTVSTTVFENLVDGRYRIKLSKNGYKERKKEIKLECAFADEDNIFTEHVYLWRDKSADTVSDSRENVSEIKKSSETISRNKTENVTQSKKSDEKLSQGTKRASGKVTIQVLIDVDGNVVSAKIIDGNPLLAEAAAKAARRAKFGPTMLAGNPVQVSGNIIYNFVP